MCGELVALPDLAGHVNDCLDEQERNAAKCGEELPPNAYFPPQRRSPAVFLDGSPVVQGGEEREVGGDDLEDWEVVSSPPGGGGGLGQQASQRGRKRRILLNHISSIVSPQKATDEKAEITDADFEDLIGDNVSLVEEQLFPASPFMNFDRYQCTKSQRDHNYDVQKQREWQPVRAQLDRSRALAAGRFKFLIRKGIPDSRRAEIWKLILAVEEYQEAHPGRYEIDRRQVFGEVLPDSHFVTPLFGGSIHADNPCLLVDGKLVQQRLLCMIASTMATIDFCPALPELIGLLLLFLNEEEAFIAATWVLRRSIKDRQYLCTSVKDLTAHIMTLRTLIGVTFPQLSSHMEALQVKMRDFALQWFSRLFVSCLPFHTVLHVMDAFLCEGIEVVYRVSLAILKGARDTLLRCTTKDQFITYVRGFCISLTDHETLMSAAFGINIRQRTLANFQEHNLRRVHDTATIQEPGSQLYYRPKILSKSSIITDSQFEIVHSWLPPKYRMKDVFCLFSTDTEGFSLTRMITNTMRHSPTVLLIKDRDHAVFGAYVTAPWRRAGGRPFGDRATFVFALLPTPQVYHWQPKTNDHWVKCDNVCFKIGDGGEGAAIQLDNELLKGRSAASLTYGNEILCGGNTVDFEALEVEVWGFV